MTNDMQSIAAKIQKLIAKADSTTHPEEADTFMAMVHKLLEEHGLDMLAVGRLDADDPVGEMHGPEYRNNSSAVWRYSVAGLLARYYGARIVGTQRGTFKYWTIFGRQSARTTFALMWPYVDRQILALAREEYRKGNFKSTKEGHRQVGYALALRLQAMVKEQEARPAPGGATTGVNALVPVDLIEQAMRDRFPSLRSGRARSVSVSNAAQGAAERINLNKQTTARKPTLRIGG